jgi:DNA-binding NarL/FixJ family response regulator
MKFLLVDDHALIREAMRGVLRDLRSDAIVLEAAHAAQALALAELHPDLALVLLDLGLPDRDGLDLLAELRQRYPALAVVVLSGDDDQGTMRQALSAGALGFIPKAESRAVLLSALGLVLSGGVYVPMQALGPSEATAAPARRPGPEAEHPTPATLGLTARQMDVLALMMQGRNNKLICRALNLAEPTVKNHVSAILRALDADSRTAAVLKVAAFGWKLPDLP